MLIGASINDSDPIASALSIKADSVQVMPDPQSWKTPSLSYDGGADAFRSAAIDAGITVYVHAPYVINVASTNNRVRIPSRKLLQQVVDLAAGIGAQGVIVHGGHVSDPSEMESGFENWGKAISGLDMTCPVFIENTAGGQHAMARYLQNIDKLWTVLAGVENGHQVGFCLDTCHAHAAGLELSGLVEKVLAITSRIDLVHANDSRDAFGSGADRHANLGHGHCDPDGLVEVVANSGAPALVETPGGLEKQAADIEWLRGRL